ncbi:hypothetical protein CRYUN_Cryun37aG0026100 [Craigia yunnanensis]
MERGAVLEGVHVKAVENSTLILAEKGTHRKDPLDNFNYYKGGWNISQKHYFSSAGFTAAPLFLIVAFWFLGFGMCLIGCIVLYVGQGKFQTSTKDTLEYVVEQADVTVDKLRNVSDYLQAAKQIVVNQITLLPNIQANMERVDKKINDSAKTLERETEENSEKIHDVLDSIIVNLPCKRLALIIIAAAMLLLAFLGFAFSVFGLSFCVYTNQFQMLDLGSTIRVALQWINGSSILQLILLLMKLSRVDRAIAEEALNESKDVNTRFVGIVNAFINNVTNLNVPPSTNPIYYNQSGPLVPVLCSPYNSDKTDRKCNADEANFSNAAQEWKKYLCLVSASGICITEGGLTRDCTFVREIFSSITRDHCPGLRRSSEMISSGLVIVSYAVTLSVTLWLLFARKRRHQEYSEYRIAASAHDHSGEEKSI